MPRVYTSKYADFLESEPVERRGKFPPHEQSFYVDVTCPHCKTICAEIPASGVKQRKASLCLQHLRVCPECEGSDKEAPEKKQKKRKVVQGQESVVIYKIIYLPENRAVYTGRTKNTERRMQQHASLMSGCRLLRDAIRRHGRSKFAIEPIMRCMATDADTNESYYIMANNTMYPNGYNLRHGSQAGVEPSDENRVIELATGIIAFSGVADEFLAQSEAVAHVADICKDLDDVSGVEATCRALLRDVHPDRAGNRSYSPDEVASMLNSVRESVRVPTD